MTAEGNNINNKSSKLTYSKKSEIEISVKIFKGELPSSYRKQLLVGDKCKNP